MGPAFFFFFPLIRNMPQFVFQGDIEVLLLTGGQKEDAWIFPFGEQANHCLYTLGFLGQLSVLHHRRGRGNPPPPNTNCATSMVNSFSTFPIQSQKNTTTSSSKHITKDFPYPCLCSVLKHPLLLCLPKSYLPIGTTVGTFSESESLPGELDIISPNSGWGGSLLPVSL